MDKYIVVTTLCDDIEIANKIIDRLLSAKLVSGSQISRVDSKYWWNGKLESSIEYKIEFRTKVIFYKEIEKEIKSIHNYDVAEISYYEINGSSEFLNWIDNTTKK